MSSTLLDALAAAQKLDEADQSDLADIVRAFVEARRGQPIALTADEEAAIDEGLAQAERGEFASQEEVDALLHRPWA